MFGGLLLAACFSIFIRGDFFNGLIAGFLWLTRGDVSFVFGSLRGRLRYLVCEGRFFLLC